MRRRVWRLVHRGTAAHSMRVDNPRGHIRAKPALSLLSSRAAQCSSSAVGLDHTSPATLHHVGTHLLTAGLRCLGRSSFLGQRLKGRIPAPPGCVAMPLPTRKLGQQGLECSAIGFGCMSLTTGSFYDTEGLSEEEAIAVVHRALDLGVTLFNTSDLYGPYKNEELLGRALEGRSAGVRIATKWGPMYAAEGGLKMDASPANCRKCCEGALARLRVPAIDLFTLRGPPDPKVPLEETMAEVKRLVEEGKVRYVGLSEVSAHDIRRAHAVVPISAVEQEWSLFTRDIEADILPTCRELGIGVLAYSPLSRGLLSGRFSTAQQLGEGDFRRHHMPRFQGDNFDKNVRLAEAVRGMAERKGCTPAQLALAWLLHKAPDVVPIPGTKSIPRLEENVGAVQVVLSPEEMAELEEAVPHDQVAGTRYASMKHGTYHGSKNKSQ